MAKRRRLLVALISHALLPMACISASTGDRGDETATQTATCATTDNVCGVDGKAYENACAAQAAGVAVDHVTNDMECDQDGRCGDVWPVCGTDGKDYDSPCRALEAGVAVAYEGECRAATETASDTDTDAGTAP